MHVIDKYINILLTNMIKGCDDPFEIFVIQKLKAGLKKPQNNNIKLNLNKLPHDFFKNKLTKKVNSHSERLVTPYPYDN